MRTVLLLALTLPLAGCFSVTAPKPVPEWAMNPQPDGAQGASPQRSAAMLQRARPAAPDSAEPAPAPGLAAVSTSGQMSDAQPTGVRPTTTPPTAAKKVVVRRKPTALPKETAAAAPTVAEPDWHARDGEVARTLNSICRGC
ncbi:MAG TPA: hypothetical protein VK438_01820 [Xanthobacteraceae bacterium]|nr:hypothetical protein [Xanthobacteraceae bacterium]